MSIIACVKQVPISTEVQIDPDTGVLQRVGIESKMNPYDLFAVEEALRLRERFGGTVIALTMGPPQAEEVIRECYYMGADDGVILTDKKFAGADVWATAYTLSQGILTLGNYDLIICGKQTTDGDTAQVGPELAEFLDIPHAANVTAVLDLGGGKGAGEISIEEERDSCMQTCRIPLPCLITVAKDLNEPRLPSYRKMKTYGNKPVRILSFADMPDPDPMHYGLDGSPTRVVRIFPPEHHTEHIRYEGSPEELTERLYRVLENEKFL